MSVQLVIWEESGWEQKFKEKEGFVASMRLDVLISLAFGLSRKTSSQLIQKQRVFVNGKLLMGGDDKRRADDVISVRGYGKFKIGELGKKSKKGRQLVKLHIFQ